MIRKVVNLVILIPVALVLIVLSVANRHMVALALNPFQPSDAALTVQAPFFLFLFATFAAGLILGSLITWFAQGRYRKRARDEAHEARKWQAEAGKQKTRAEQLVAQALVPVSSV